MKTKLQNCPACQTSISSQAEQCPSCGHPDPFNAVQNKAAKESMKSTLVWLFVLLLLLNIGIYIWFYGLP
jgi:predicted amidophosphoribosyltransferase